MIMKEKELTDTGLLLKCPGFDRLSGLAKIVVKEALISFLLDRSDPNASLDDEYYYSEVQEIVYDEDGDIRNGLEMYNKQEWLNFASDHANNVRRLEEEIKKALELVLSLNADLIESAYREVDFVTLHADKDFKNHIMLRVHGVSE